jgi:ribosomal protein L37AE/L43A
MLIYYIRAIRHWSGRGIMKLSISKCSRCNRARLVDNVAGRWICFACKQKMGRVALAELQGKLTSFPQSSSGHAVIDVVPIPAAKERSRAPKISMKARI